MIQLRKVLAFAISAALTLMATLSANAFAANLNFKFGVEKETIFGVHEGTEEFTFEFGTVKCSIGEYLGKVVAPTKEGNQVPLAPKYAECSLGTMSVEVKPESCWWTFHSGVSEGVNLEGEMDVACNGVKEEIVFIVKEGAETKCTIRLPQQQGMKGITYTVKEIENIKDVTADIGLTSLAYTQTAGMGKGACVAASKATGKYTAHPTIRGVDEKGVPAGFWVE